MLDLTKYRKNKDKLISYLDLIDKIESLTIRYLTWKEYGYKTEGDGLDGAMNFREDVLDTIDILANQSSRTINRDQDKEKTVDLVATYNDHNIWCSECMTEWTADDYKWNFVKTFQYCPHCGAKVEHVVVLPDIYTPGELDDEDEEEWCNYFGDYCSPFCADYNNCPFDKEDEKEEETND